MSDTEHPFVPGTEVAVVSRPHFGNSVSYRRAKVGKLYKTGRFILEGSTQQYKPSKNHFGSGQWQAFSTGSGYGGGSTVELITPRLIEEVEAYKRQVEFQDACIAIERRGRSLRPVSAEHLKAVKDALAVLK